MINYKILTTMKNITLFVLFILFLGNAYSQQDSLEEITIGKKYKFYSQVLDEERELWIGLPKTYETNTTEKFPVVYLLDGSSHFTFMTGLLQKFTAKGIPPSILVGVENTDRRRDMSPPTQNNNEMKSNPESGGADNFIKMFEEDLIPFVNNNFRTKDFKTLIGHSFGGLFITYAIAKKPELFNAYISVSPSLWWNDQKTVDIFEESLKDNPEMEGILYMTMGNERGKMLGGMMKLVGVLESEQPVNFRWDYKVHPNETHGTIPNISELEGFEFIYKDWYVPNPHLDFLRGGFTHFENRAKRIKEEFDEDWELGNPQMVTIINELNEIKNYKIAIEIGEQFLPKIENSPRFYFALGEGYLGNEDTEMAKKYFSKAYKLAPCVNNYEQMVDSFKIDKSVLVPDVKLLKSLTNKYIGKYKLSGDLIITISEAGDSLKYNQSNLSKDFYAKPFDKDGHFYFLDAGYSMDFIFGDKNDDIASKLIIRDPYGEEVSAIRIEDE